MKHSFSPGASNPANPRISFAFFPLVMVTSHLLARYLSMIATEDPESNITLTRNPSLSTFLPMIMSTIGRLPVSGAGTITLFLVS